MVVERILTSDESFIAVGDEILTVSKRTRLDGIVTLHTEVQRLIP
jgi:hypothetical protein